MNHDDTHCMDFTFRCPKDCYRARLTDDLSKSGINPLDVRWQHFNGTAECPKNKKQEAVSEP